MTALRLVRFSLVVGLLCFFAGAASAKPVPRALAAGLPTTASSPSVVVGAQSVLRVGNAVYVAGVSRVAPPTGSAVVVSTAKGQAEPIRAQVAGGPVWAAVPDGGGGWYIGGSFTSVGGVLRSGLAHLLADGSLDAAFAPPELGEVRALALDGGRLYVGGVEPLAAAPSFLAFLSALDPATGGVLVSYQLPSRTVVDDESPLSGVVALAAGNGRVVAAFNGDNGIAAYNETSGARLWSRPGTPSYSPGGGPAALAVVAGRLLIGGEISTPSGRVYLQELDPATGALLAQPAVAGPVSKIATVANTAYLMVVGRNGGSVWKLKPSSGLLTRIAALRFCSAIATDGTTLYVAGSTTGLVGTVAFDAHLRVYALNLGQAKPSPQPLSQVLAGGNANTLALQSGRLLVGGSFLGMGGVERAGLAAFDAQTGALLPWRPTVQDGHVSALAGSGTTIYLGGAFKGVSGHPRRGLAAVSSLGTGKLLRWNPRLSQASIAALAVAGGRVFAGGGLKPPGAKPSTKFKHLLAFSVETGRQLPFTPQLGHVNLLAVGQGLLLAKNSCNHGYPFSSWYSCVTAFRVSGKGRALWRQSIKGSVSALQPSGSTLYLGGSVEKCANCSETGLLAALTLKQAGAPLKFHPDITPPVSALAPTDYGLLVATADLAGGGPYFVGTQALRAVSPDGQVLPWQITFPPNDPWLAPFDFNSGVENGALGQLVPVPGGLVASGDFSWIGPPDNPAPGSLVWLR
jgi:outer membrane protein assembly factor BamB